MIRRLLAITTIAYMIIVIVLPFVFNGNVDDGAVRYKSNGDVLYLDLDSIPASSTSDENSSLRSAAIRANNIVNEERAKDGLGELDWDQDLEAVSAVRAKECSEKFSHTRPSGAQWYTVNSAIQGGENLAYGQSTANQVVQDWMNSPTHKENILYDEFTKCAISIYQDDDGTYYWAQEFSY